MLSPGLIETLLDKKIINNSTQMYVEFTKTDQSLRGLTLKDICTVDEVLRDTDNKYIFKLTRLDCKEPITVPAEKVLLIDGMDPKTLCKAFELNVDGSKKKLGKRRGRPRTHFPYGE